MDAVQLDFFAKYLDNTLTMIYILITLSNKRCNMKNKEQIEAYKKTGKTPRLHPKGHNCG